MLDYTTMLPDPWGEQCDSPCVRETFYAPLPLESHQVDYLELLARGLFDALTREDYERLAVHAPAEYLEADLARLGGAVHFRQEQVLLEDFATGPQWPGPVRVTRFRSNTHEVDLDPFWLIREPIGGDAFIAGDSCQSGMLEQLLGVVLARFDLDYALIIPFALIGKGEAGEGVHGGGVMVVTRKGASCVDGEVAGHLGCLLAIAPAESSQEREAARGAIRSLLEMSAGAEAEQLMGALQAELLEMAREHHSSE